MLGRFDSNLKNFLRAWKDSQKFTRDSDAWDATVIYSEGDTYAPYLHPLIDGLGQLQDKTIYYLTSDTADKILLNPPQHVRSFYIGKGNVRTLVLNRMKARLLVTTMPDINTFHIKRSLDVQHYAYVHHSMVSTHMVYRKGAFDHFDSVMTTGPYQNMEIRKWEKFHGLPEKELFDHGYPPMDALVELAAKSPPSTFGDDGKALNILLAPTWGSEGVMETRAKEIVQILLDDGHYVRVRPHPRTRQLAGVVLDDLARMFRDHPGFDMDEDVTKSNALLQSDIMISDWSGVSMEFAFGLGRPVLFVDVPRKINNPEYETVELTPLEVSYRKKVGAIIQPDNLADIPNVLAFLVGRASEIEANAVKLREETFYNLGASGRRGAEILVELANRLSKTGL